MAEQNTTTVSHDRYVATENYIRDVLRIMGQHADADDQRLVGRIAAKLLRSLHVWTHSDSPLRELFANENSTTREMKLEAALRALLKADRGFLGSDNWCVYCDALQATGHAPHCVITQAREALEDV